MSKIPVWSVREAEPHKDFTITIKFQDGSVRLYDAKPLLKLPIFEQLRNPGLFMQARAEYGTVVWNDDTDIAPEHLYEASEILSSGE